MDERDETPERLAGIARSLGIPGARRHIFLCSDPAKPKCCDREHGLAAWDYLKARLKELGLADSGRVLRTRPNRSPASIITEDEFSRHVAEISGGACHG